MHNQIIKQTTFLIALTAIICSLIIGVVSVSATIDDGSPDLNISKSANPSSGSIVKPGDEIVYTLAYSNSGTGEATNVFIVDPLPANTSFVSASDGGSLVGGAVRWNSIGTLAAGASGSVTLKVKVKSSATNGTTISNLAGIDSDQSPPLHSSRITHRVHFGTVVLSIEKSANPVSGSTVKEGDNITYTLTYKNSGNQAATGVKITDLLPDNTSFVQASDGGTLSGGVVSWSIGTVAADSSGSVTLVVKVNSPLASGTVISNHAIVSNKTSTVKSKTVTHTVTKEIPVTQETQNNQNSVPTTNNPSVQESDDNKKTISGTATKEKNEVSAKSSKKTSGENKDEFPRTDIPKSIWPLFIYIALVITMLTMLLFKYRAKKGESQI